MKMIAWSIGVLTLALGTAFAENRRATCGFSDFFETNTEGPGIHKWLHYFPIYEREFGEHCGAGASPVKMIEIGIQSGGSVRMWRHAFGDALELFVGVDINPNTKAWERFGDEPGSRAGNVRVEIGSQADPKIFTRINAKYPGGFDIILDDGSHTTEHMVASFKHAFEKILKPGGVYLIEDITKENVEAVHQILGLSNSKGLMKHRGETANKGKTAHLARSFRYKDSEMNLVDALYYNNGPACCQYPPNEVQSEVEYITEYPMMLAIKKREHPLAIMEAIQHGTQWIPI